MLMIVGVVFIFALFFFATSRAVIRSVKTTTKAAGVYYDFLRFRNLGVEGVKHDLLNMCIEIAEIEAMEWSSNDVILDKNYAQAVADKIRIELNM